VTIPSKKLFESNFMVNPHWVRTFVHPFVRSYPNLTTLEPEKRGDPFPFHFSHSKPKQTEVELCALGNLGLAK